MKNGNLLLRLLVALSTFSVVSGCAGRPVTPPTFVMAWTQTGAAGQVWTVESNDGIVWRNANPQNLQGNLSESEFGPAIAHDGNLAWMLMWANPRGLDYKTGIGGVALSGQGGVVWEPQPLQGLLPFSALGGRPAGTPALAYGSDRWIAAFRTRATGDKISVVRSLPNSATGWEATRDVEIQTPVGLRNLSSQHDPALAYGNGTFVLLHRSPTTFVASTSTDGVTWVDRGPVAQIPTAEMSTPAVTFSSGNFYAALRKELPFPPGWGSGARPSAAEIYKSSDGATWTRVADQAGYFAPTGREYGPGISFGDFGNNVCKAILTDRAVQLFPGSIGAARGIQFWTGAPPPPHTCQDPALLQFIPSEAAGDEITNRDTAYGTAIAFGKTTRP